MPRYTIEHRVWTHAPPPPGDVDHRGHMRWVVSDDGIVVDHYARESDARDALVSLVNGCYYMD